MFWNRRCLRRALQHVASEINVGSNRLRTWLLCVQRRRGQLPKLPTGVLRHMRNYMLPVEDLSVLAHSL